MPALKGSIPHSFLHVELLKGDVALIVSSLCFTAHLFPFSSAPLAALYFPGWDACFRKCGKQRLTYFPVPFWKILTHWSVFSKKELYLSVGSYPGLKLSVCQCSRQVAATCSVKWSQCGSALNLHSFKRPAGGDCTGCKKRLRLYIVLLRLYRRLWENDPT